MIEIRRYVTRGGKDVVGQWLRDLDTNARARVAARIDRLSLGNFGDCKSLRKGVSELRIDWGPGYRLYYGCWAACAFSFCAEVTSANSLPISREPLNISKTIRKGQGSHETQSQHCA
ncbi:MAG: type II toxin-antitoxin system RelE/ParE family toxin [Acidobacteriaceae bacterium]